MKKIVIKIGGSLITYRDKYCEANYVNLERICDEITSAINKENIQLIIIIGGGSYGHQVAYKYKLHEGFKDKSQLFALRIMTNKMWELGVIVGDMFAQRDIPTYCFHNPSCTITENALLDHMFIEPIEQCSNSGIIPILWGEANFDRSRNFATISGDILAPYLAMKMNADKVFMFSDVDGVYKNYGSQMQTIFTRIDSSNYGDTLKEICAPNKIDINGGMKMKLDSMSKLMGSGIVGYIGNGNKENLVYNALVGNITEGTYIY